MLQNLWDISPILSLLLFTVGGLVTYIKIKDKQNLNITQQMVDVLKSETISAKQESRELKEAFNTVTKTFQDTMQSLKNENDENENLRYPVLDDQIENTYVKKSTAKASHAVYDSYIRAIRWASNRIDKKGIIGFITSNSYIDARSLDGLRSCLHAEFNHLYVFNLKGAIRGKVGIDAKKEGENIFPITNLRVLMNLFQ